MTELELATRCSQGDPDARRELYDRTSDRIYGLLLKMTGRPEDAFDLAQDVYLRVFDRIGSFRGDSTLLTWIHRVAVNEALQHLRSRKRENTRLAGITPQANAPDASPHHDAAWDVREALMTLSASDRTILLLRYYQGHDYRRIGEILECTVGTVSSRLNRARERLREQLGESYGFREDQPATEHPRGGEGARADERRNPEQ